MATNTSLSEVFPLGSRLNERGRLEVGGCDTIELAREFGTPAYIVAEDDLRSRARAFLQAGRDPVQSGFRPERLVFHGNAKSETELGMAVGLGVGLIVVDNLGEIDRLEALLAERDGAAQRLLVRVTPDVRGETHEKISTGQADSKFGFSMAAVPEAIERVEVVEGLRLEGGHAHIGSQLLELEPFRREVAEVGKRGDFPVWDLGGG